MGTFDETVKVGAEAPCLGTYDLGCCIIVVSMSCDTMRKHMWYTYMCIYIYIYIYVCIHIYTYIHRLTITSLNE